MLRPGSQAPANRSRIPITAETARKKTGCRLIFFIAKYRITSSPDVGSATVRQRVAVNNYVDGDTTHFIVPASVDPSGEFRARYIAVNTPESTGKIEEWGKAASRFTKEKLENAEEILIESDSDQWNPDSTSSRYLVWVWYRPAGEQDYRNLNIELLQNGLALGYLHVQDGAGHGGVHLGAVGNGRGLGGGGLGGGSGGLGGGLRRGGSGSGRFASGHFFHFYFISDTVHGDIEFTHDISSQSVIIRSFIVWGFSSKF